MLCVKSCFYLMILPYYKDEDQQFFHGSHIQSTHSELLFWPETYSTQVRKPKASEYTSLISYVYVLRTLLWTLPQWLLLPFEFITVMTKQLFEENLKKIFFFREYRHKNKLHKWLFSNWLSEYSPCFQLVRQTVSPALKNVQVKHSSQAKFICIALFTIHAVSMQLYRKSWC